MIGFINSNSEPSALSTLDGLLQLVRVHENEKEYRVLVARRPDNEQLDAWRRGVVLPEGDRTQPAIVHFVSTSGKGAWIRVVMGEGKKRQIREVGKLLGLPVVRIVRVRIGTLKLGDLKPRQWRYLTEDEVLELKGDKVPKMEQKLRPKRPMQRTNRTLNKRK